MSEREQQPRKIAINIVWVGSDINSDIPGPLELLLDMENLNLLTITNWSVNCVLIDWCVHFKEDGVIKEMGKGGWFKKKGYRACAWSSLPIICR